MMINGALSGTRTQDNYQFLIILFNELLSRTLLKLIDMGMKCINSRIYAYIGHVYEMDCIEHNFIVLGYGIMWSNKVRHKKKCLNN